MPPTIFIAAAIMIFVVGVAHTRLRVRLLARGTNTFARVSKVAQFGNRSIFGFVWPADIEFLDQDGTRRTSVVLVWSFERGGAFWGRPGHLIGQELKVIHNGEPNIEVCRVWPKWLVPMAFICEEARIYVVALFVMLLAFGHARN